MHPTKAEPELDLGADALAAQEARWEHPCCWACWRERNPDKPGRAEPKMVGASLPAYLRAETCCFCGFAVTFQGIYVREDPAKLACGGEHEGPGPHHLGWPAEG